VFLVHCCLTCACVVWKNKEFIFSTHQLPSRCCFSVLSNGRLYLWPALTDLHHCELGNTVWWCCHTQNGIESVESTEKHGQQHSSRQHNLHQEPPVNKFTSSSSSSSSTSSTLIKQNELLAMFILESCCSEKSRLLVC